jgi:hypothetical protein
MLNRYYLGCSGGLMELEWWTREKERKAAAQGEKSGMLKGISC